MLLFYFVLLCNVNTVWADDKMDHPTSQFSLQTSADRQLELQVRDELSTTLHMEK